MFRCIGQQDQQLLFCGLRLLLQPIYGSQLQVRISILAISTDSGSEALLCFFKAAIPLHVQSFFIQLFCAVTGWCTRQKA